MYLQTCLIVKHIFAIFDSFKVIISNISLGLVLVYFYCYILSYKAAHDLSNLCGCMIVKVLEKTLLNITYFFFPMWTLLTFPYRKSWEQILIKLFYIFQEFGGFLFIYLFYLLELIFFGYTYFSCYILIYFFEIIKKWYRSFS